MQREAYLQAVRIYKEVYNEDSDEVLEVVQQLGDSTFREGSLDEAMESYRETLRLYGLRQERKTFEVVELYKCMASVAFLKGDFESSVYYDRQALEFYLEEKLLGRTEDVYERLGEAFIKLW